MPAVEKAIVDSGVILLKYWLEVSPEEQTRRLEARIDDGRKIWKLSPMDLKSYSRWYDYSRARDEMFAATDTRLRALVRGAQRRQAARAPQHHLAPARADSLQGIDRGEDQAAEAAEARQLPRTQLSVTSSSRNATERMNHTGTGKYELLLARCRVWSRSGPRWRIPAMPRPWPPPWRPRRRGSIIPILVGPVARIRESADKAQIDLGTIEIVDAPHSHAAAAKAVHWCARARRNC